MSAVSDVVVAQQHDSRPAAGLVVVQGVVLLVLGFLLSSFGYVLGDISFNPFELLGAALFWFAVVYLLLALPFREASRSFAHHARGWFGSLVFVCYLAIHLVLYGFILEAILSTVYGSAELAVTPSFLIATNVFSPPSILSTLFDLAYNPSIVVTIPPIFSAALSFYSISVAIVIAVLVVASIRKTAEIGELCTRSRRARSFVLFPALGIVFGASCCLSVAGLVSLAIPSATLLTSVLWVYYATFFLFPAVAMVLLYLNLRSIDKLSAALAASLSSQSVQR